MIQTANWFSLLIFLALLMVIFIGMSRAVLRMLHTPGRSSAPAAADRERLNLSHALGLYAVAASVPLAVFQPPALFDSLHAILAAFGVKL
jgi:Na+-transporting methylmalonyl-CoA/oxaloacetate decarboxylase gamma subunit